MYDKAQIQLQEYSLPLTRVCAVCSFMRVLKEVAIDTDA